MWCSPRQTQTTLQITFLGKVVCGLQANIAQVIVLQNQHTQTKVYNETMKKTFLYLKFFLKREVLLFETHFFLLIDLRMWALFFQFFFFFFYVVAVHTSNLSYKRFYKSATIQWHITLLLFQITRIKLHSVNCLSLREAGYIAANQAIPIKQAKTANYLVRSCKLAYNEPLACQGKLVS